MARKKVTTSTPPAPRKRKLKPHSEYERGMTGFIISHIREAVERATKTIAERTVYAGMELQLNTKEIQEKFESLITEDNMQELAQGIATTYMVTTIEQLWAQGGGNNPQEHLPEIWKGHEKSQDAMNQEREASRDAANNPKSLKGALSPMRYYDDAKEVTGSHPMMAGFTALKEKITDMSNVSTGGSVGVDIGAWPELMNMKLSQYMQKPHDRQSHLNSFLFAVEFGTGIAENVGGPKWVRTAGNTKEPSGVWWYGAKAGMGQPWEGQKGLHFLFDENKRERQLAYYSAFKDNAKAYTLDFFNKKLGR
jgi:hypothetical protein